MGVKAQSESKAWKGEKGPYRSIFFFGDECVFSGDGLTFDSNVAVRRTSHLQSTFLGVVVKRVDVPRS